MSRRAGVNARARPAAPPVATRAQRRRVVVELERRGLLLVQGQWEIPSVADLLAGRAVAARGYSWDYVPAWTFAYELARGPGVADPKLFRGLRTLVHARLWPAVDAIAQANVAAVRAGIAGDGHRRLLAAIEANPGIPGHALDEGLALFAATAPRKLRRIRQDLEAWCCVAPEDQADAPYHTHDRAWLPWSHGKVARGATAARKPNLDEAARMLLVTVPDARARPGVLFPCLGPGSVGR